MPKIVLSCLSEHRWLAIAWSGRTPGELRGTAKRSLRLALLCWASGHRPGEQAAALERASPSFFCRRAEAASQIVRGTLPGDEPLLALVPGDSASKSPVEPLLSACQQD